MKSDQMMLLSMLLMVMLVMTRCCVGAPVELSTAARRVKHRGRHTDFWGSQGGDSLQQSSSKRHLTSYPRTSTPPLPLHSTNSSVPCGLTTICQPAVAAREKLSQCRPRC